MQFASLGSGSKGNATLVKTANTTLLIDCGFSLKQTELRLQNHLQSPAQIDGILVTHEHHDHIGGVSKLSQKYNIKVWGSCGTLAKQTLPDKKFINIHQDFKINDLTISPVAIPHDAKEPCQFVISDGKKRLGILTDIGHITPHILKSFNKCNALMLETNYDHASLINGSYPEQLKHRISGKLGHLSNSQAVDFIDKLDTRVLNTIVLMHLSESNNSPKLAADEVRKVLPNNVTNLVIANQEMGFDWLDI